MSEKKNIDRLFQEKFKDFEAAPPQFVWDNLEEILQKKKKRRVIPIWIRLGGVAAILVVGMLFLYPFFAGDTTGNGVVYDNQPQQPDNGTQQNPAGINTPVPPNRNVGNGQGAGINPEAIVSALENSINTDKNNNSPGNKGNATAGHNATTQSASNGSNNSSKNANTNSAVAQGKTKKANRHTNPEKHTLTPQQQSLAENNANNNRTANGGNATQGGALPNGNNPTQITIDNTLPLPQQQTGVAVQQDVQRQPGNNNTITTDNQQQATDIIKRDIPVVPNEAVAETTPTDTIPEENELDKLLQEKLKGKDKDKAVAEANAKWNIKPQMGPLLYSSLSGGSPIDAQFASNSKSYENELSYGLGVNYAINNRLTLRSGINTVNLSYATEGVEFYASLNNQTNNVARSGGANIVVQNQQPFTPGLAAGFSSDQLPQEKFDGSMMQKTGYIEVPLEMSYALLNKKFGINLIGGVSTLFLNQNNVSVVSTQGFSTDVGEAQNLNNIHFSTNVGVGFKYKFFKQFEASFEPTFKYQVNAYSRDAGNFKPYFIGLYTGVSFSF